MAEAKQKVLAIRNTVIDGSPVQAGEVFNATAKSAIAVRDAGKCKFVGGDDGTKWNKHEAADAQYVAAWFEQHGGKRRKKAAGPGDGGGDTGDGAGSTPAGGNNGGAGDDTAGGGQA